MNKVLIVCLVSALLVTSRLFGQSDAGKGIDTRNIDKSVNPSQDFYMYANGIWVQRNPVPDTESRWSSFDEVKTRNQEELRKLLDDLSTHKLLPSEITAGDQQNINQLTRFYQSGLMGTQASNDEVVRSVAPLMQELAVVQDLPMLSGTLAKLTLAGVSPLFSIYVAADRNNSSVYALYMGQGGLSLPDRDYYLQDTEERIKTRQMFKEHIEAVFIAFKEDAAIAREAASDVLAIETELARVSLPRTALRDPHKTNNIFTIPELMQLIPELSMDVYFNELGITPPEKVIINNPDFFRQLGKFGMNISPEQWNRFMRWKVYRYAAPFLSEALRRESFMFNENHLKGVRQMPERWKSVLETSQAQMPDALGQLFCERFYDTQAEARMTELIGNVKSAFRQRLSALPWMTPETRNYAVAKLDAITWKIGRPSKWRDYSQVGLSGDFFQNVVSFSSFEFKRRLGQIGMPVDKTEWRISAATVNAYYNASANEIVFPAGILQPPFFDKDADNAVIYGAIGAVIGHEIIHGFDDQGRKFDAQGNLHNWWTPKDSAAFSGIAQKIVDQYGNYTVNGKLNVNGKLTLGENIADIGGLAIAFDAFNLSRKNKAEEQNIDGFTPEQRFFLSFAQVWRNNIRPEEAERRILTDPHSPGMYRCNGTVSNMESFYAAFGVKAGNAMYRNPAERVVIW